MSQSPIQAAIQQICQEKNLEESVVLHAIDSAMAAAYRKDFGNKLQNIIANFDPKTGEVEVFDVKTVVEDLPEVDEDGNYILPEKVEEETKTEKSKSKKTKKEEAGGSFAAAFAAAIKAKQDEETAPTEPGTQKPAEEKVKKSFLAEEAEGEDERKFNPKTEIELKTALETKPDAKIGDEIITPLEITGEFGRMAAQTAKQVIIQKLREEERNKIFEEYKMLENSILTGTIQRRDGRNVLIDIGNTVAIMPPEEQVDRERYHTGNRMKFFLKSVDAELRGSMLIVSRASIELVKGIFEDEIPEIASGVIEIKSISREPGGRTKVAITSHEENIDPIGSCVGQRGSRIQTIISELSGEKVDIILWDENPAKFITNALSPAKILNVETDEASHSAKVTVIEDQLSLAIGRGGQNVRLASKLTGWKIDIISEGGKSPEELLTASASSSVETTADEKATAVKEESEEEVTATEATVVKEDEETTETTESETTETPTEEATATAVEEETETAE